MIDVNELKRLAASMGMTDPSLVERDYLLSWILKAIAEENKLSKKIIFKGGTALKKIYYDDFRFSIDLDFTVKKEPADLLRTIENSVEHTLQDSNLYLKDKIKITADEENFTEITIPLRKITHPQGPPLNVYIHLDFNEYLTFKEAEYPIKHKYSDSNIFSNTKIKAYRIKEILLEKLRAAYFQRVFAISKDLFDIWWIMREENTNPEKLFEHLEKKCQIKQISFSNPELKDKKSFELDYRNNLKPLLPSKLKVKFSEIWQTAEKIYLKLQS